MKQYASHRRYKEIKKACKAKGFPFRDKKYKEGSDYVGFDFKHEETIMEVLYSSFNGRAFGFITSGPHNGEFFCTSETEHETLPCFMALLDFIYIPLEQNAAAH